MNKRKVITLIVAIVILGTLAAIISSKLKANKKVLNENAAISQIVNDAIPVTAEVVEEMEFKNSFAGDGSFAPTQRISVASDAQGKITKLNVNDGTFVSKGAVLAILDHTLLSNQSSSIEVNIAKSTKDLQRLKTLLQSGGATQSQIDEIENGIKQYEIQLSSIKKQISDAYLKAPISGTIVNKKIEHGMYVSVGMPILDIVNISTLDFQTYLTESQVFKTKLGQSVRLSTNVYPGVDFNGNVKFIDVAASPTKTYLVEIAVPNSNAHPLKAGLDGKAYFEGSGSSKSPAVSRSAIVGSFDEAQVYIIKDSIVSLIPVDIGLSTNDKVQITGGLQFGDRVVTSGQINLKEGTKISVSNTIAAANQ